jgi:hypothetical protein
MKKTEIQSQTERTAWEALQSDFETLEELHPCMSFADDPLIVSGALAARRDK